eukprot:6133527-Amphidinium_carterae.1
MPTWITTHSYPRHSKLASAVSGLQATPRCCPGFGPKTYSTSIPTCTSDVRLAWPAGGGQVSPPLYR